MMRPDKLALGLTGILILVGLVMAKPIANNPGDRGHWRDYAKIEGSGTIRILLCRSDWQISLVAAALQKSMPKPRWNEQNGA